MAGSRGFFSLWACVLLGTLSTRAEDAPKGQRVFTAGHSFHMMIPGPLAEMARQAGINGHTIAGTQSIGGSRTLQHWERPDDMNKAKQTIKAGKVDVLTLSPHVRLPDEGIDHFTALMLEHNPKGRVLVQMSWYPHDMPGNTRGNFKNEDRDKAKIEELRKGSAAFHTGLSDQVKKLNEKHKKDVAFLVPVGTAVMNLREKVVAGKVPGIAKQSELFTDPIGHAKEPVSILNAYCHFAVIYRRSPVGLAVPNALKRGRSAEDAEKLNRLLQETAWEAVTREPLSGVK
jgi:hypothetical protein